MIPRSADWKNALATAVRDPAELIALLDLPRDLLTPARRAATQFPLRVPRGYLARMRRGDPDDPLLRQVLPLDAEGRPAPGFLPDPVGDADAAVQPGVLQKYAGRVLLVATGACAVHCRYCFRRHFPYDESEPARGRWDEALEGVAGDPTIHEVILSGGDPLALDDGRLGRLVAAVECIPHVERLRIHSRLPVVLPERVDDGLLEWLGSGRLRKVMVIHANHPRELDATVADAAGRLARAGVVLLNQTVLLRGVNDDPEALCELSERLFAIGVLPYYLHLLDRVAGAAHFEVTADRTAMLLEAMRCNLPGYLVPRVVRERAGAGYKLPFEPHAVHD